jgi:hypothetical protein
MCNTAKGTCDPAVYKGKDCLGFPRSVVYNSTARNALPAKCQQCLAKMNDGCGLVDPNAKPSPENGMQMMQEMMSSAKACGIKIPTEPCASGSMVSSSGVQVNVKLEGVSKAQFGATEQAAFIQGVAKSAGVMTSAVVITDISDSRRSGVTVQTRITVVGADSAKKAAEVQQKVSDSATLQKNIKSAAAGTPLAAATVPSVAVKQAYTQKAAGGASSSSGSNVGMIVGVVIAAVAVVAIVVGAAFFFMRRGNQAGDGTAVHGKPGQGTTKDLEIASESKL